MWNKLAAVCDKIKIGDHFIKNKQHLHINFLELLAAFFGLETFVKASNIHVKVFYQKIRRVRKGMDAE